jgi:hypothetical protein
MNAIMKFVDPVLLLTLLAQVALLFGAFLLARRLKKTLARGAAFAVLAMLALHLALFGNPLAWGTYYFALRDHADWRQSDIMAERFKSMTPTGKGVEWLAVGSSQTHAIYGEIAKNRDDLEVFSLAGMTPMDMVLYQDRILRLKPRHVLLYISEFDLAAELRPEWARLAPVAALRIRSVTDQLMASVPPDSFPNLRRDLLIGDLLPAYRYNFVFRGMLSRVAEAVGIPGFRSQRQADDQADYAALHARGRHSMESMAKLLESFIDTLQNAGTQTVIVEGQYNPLGETPDLMRQHAEFVTWLADLQRRRPGLRAIRRDELPVMGTADFGDAYHLSKTSAYRLAESILQKANGSDRSLTSSTQP